MKTPILFLDVDGVLNSCNWFKSAEGRARHFIEDWRETHIDPTAIIFLNRIVSEAKCDIVLSSTWRRGNPLGSTLRCFRKKGLTDEAWDAFIGMTPVIERQFPSSSIYAAPCRGNEIQAWLDDNPGRKESAICILDDDGDMAHLMPHLVLTNGNEGLTHEIAMAVIAKLKHVH